MEKNALNFRKQLKEFGVFYTPIEVCKIMKSYIPFEPEEVYDPTVGQGNLLSVFGDNVKKYGQEIFEEELEKAKVNLKNFEGRCGDTLQDDKFKGRQFQCISSNPPYSVHYDPDSLKDDERFNKAPAMAPKSKADWAFLLHILNHLKDDGIAVVLVFPGILYRGNSEKKIRQWFVDNNYIERIVEVPGDKFVDTKIATDILVLRKNKTTTDVIFEDISKGLTATITYDEIKQNDFNLSVSTYIKYEEEKEEIDIAVLNTECCSLTLKNIARSIAYEFNMTTIFTKEYKELNDFLNSIIDVCIKKKEELIKILTDEQKEGDDL